MRPPSLGPAPSPEVTTRRLRFAIAHDQMMAMGRIRSPRDLRRYRSWRKAKWLAGRALGWV